MAVCFHAIFYLLQLGADGPEHSVVWGILEENLVIAILFDGEGPIYEVVLRAEDDAGRTVVAVLDKHFGDEGIFHDISH